MARPNHPNIPAINYGKLVYPPGEYSSSGDTFVNTTPKFFGNEDFMPDYTTVCYHYFSSRHMLTFAVNF